MHYKTYHLLYILNVPVIIQLILKFDNSITFKLTLLHVNTLQCLYIHEESKRKR